MGFSGGVSIVFHQKRKVFRKVKYCKNILHFKN